MFTGNRSIDIAISIIVLIPAIILLYKLKQFEQQTSVKDYDSLTREQQLKKVYHSLFIAKSKRSKTVLLSDYLQVLTLLPDETLQNELKQELLSNYKNHIESNSKKKTFHISKCIIFIDEFIYYKK